MKLYTGLGTNSRIVLLFLAEKGVEIEQQYIDIVQSEQRSPAFLTKNPLGQVPVLECDDGFCISQVTAICEYLEELYPLPPLIGATPKERAETRMWLRRIDLNIVEPIVNGYRYGEGLSFYQPRERCIPQAADDLKAQARENLAWLDAQIGSRQFICGERFTLADIFLFCFIEFAAQFGQKIESGSPTHQNILSLCARIGARCAPAS